ncbi:hypothetical protein DICVIV_11366 [Dictyocaulus viviparus]|uniref:Uncharacterized protein n=1 Tax=Dictyocaulus viviparus TaxID=29172 RepID=A0A0D8XDD3_DICVI|nr:hypothetical protein DICVIV_11366 [Dictyocaulus viviparus]
MDERGPNEKVAEVRTLREDQSFIQVFNYVMDCVMTTLRVIRRTSTEAKEKSPRRLDNRSSSQQGQSPQFRCCVAVRNSKSSAHLFLELTWPLSRKGIH